MMKGYFAFSIHKNRIRFILLDLLTLFISVFVSFLIRVQFDLQLLSDISIYKFLIYYLILLFQMIVFFYILGIYDRKSLSILSQSFLKLALALLIMGLLNSLFFYFQQTIYIGRLVLILQLLIFFILSITGRKILISQIRQKQSQTNLILINLNSDEKNMLLLEGDLDNNFNLVYFEYSDTKILAEFIKNLDVDPIIVLSNSSDSINRDLSYLISLKFNKYYIYDFKTFYINVTGKIPDSTAEEIWSIISENEFIMGIKSYYRLKRLLDFSLTFLILILTLPLFFLIMILIKLSSKGPVFFIQERLGWNKTPFNLFKFRTMKINAEPENKPQWAIENDPRINLIGKFLRKTRLDELPQLINILKGEMSFVGTRPIRNHFAEILAKEIPFYDIRFFIQPGLTGWSQVKYNYAGTIDEQIEKFKYELFYLKNMSFSLDMIILLKTIKTVLSFNGK